MDIISSAKAFETLKGLGNPYVIEADELNFLIENGEEVQCLRNDRVIVVIHRDEGTEYVSIIPTYHEFDADEVLTTIQKKCGDPNLLVDFHPLSGEFSSLLRDKLDRSYTYERSIVDYIRESGDASFLMADDIRLLGPSDKEAFAASFDEKLINRPPASTLFEVFINRGHGEIFAALEEGNMVGYLSFTPILDAIYDVDYIYVVPKRRGMGIGKRLGNAYASYAAEHGRCAYWSNAKNEVSEKTAVSCGFVKIRDVHKYVCLSKQHGS